MKYLNIDNSNVQIIEQVKNMDPFKMLDYLNLPGHYALVAIEDADTPDEDVLVSDTALSYKEKDIRALLIYSLESDALVIKWMYVKGEFRGQSIGEAMLIHILEYAKEHDFKYVKAYFTDDEMRKEAFPEEERFFAERLFEEEAEAVGEWLIDVSSDFAEYTVEDGISDVSDEQTVYDSGLSVSPIRLLFKREAEEVLSFFEEHIDKCDTASLCKDFDFRKDIDKDLSIVFFKDNKPAGGIISKSVTDEISSETVKELYGDEYENEIEYSIVYPVLIVEGNDEDNKLLMKNFIESAKVKCAKGGIIHLIPKEYSPIFDFLPDKCHVSGKYLQCDLLTYMLWKSVNK